jgi:hypothetical protein
MQVTGEAPLPYDGEPFALPASGRPHDSITLQRNQDYPADSDLCFAAGNSETRVRLTGRDVHELRALLLDQGVDLAGLRERALELARHNVPTMGIAKRTAHVAAVQDLAVTAHATGYRLCAEDHRVTAQDQGYVSDFLGDLLTDGEDRPHADVEALERVIAMLESS